jgi:hypothetical protein
MREDAPSEQSVRAFVQGVLAVHPDADVAAIMTAWRVRRGMTLEADEATLFTRIADEEVRSWRQRPTYWAEVAEEASRRRPMSEGSSAIGCLIVLGFHIVGLLLSVGLVGLVNVFLGARGAAFYFFLPFLFIGVTQLLWVIPAVLIARSMGRTETMKGIKSAAALTFILNSACHGLIWLPLTFRR